MLTRENAIDSIIGADPAQNFPVMASSDVEMLINKIYDSFEEVMKSKDCGTCVHLRPKTMICMKRVQLHDGSLPTPFYCSEYALKDTHNDNKKTSI